MPPTASLPAGEAAPKFTIDRFLGGRVEAEQPGGGAHRAGLEAVLLGASLPATLHGTVIDLGAGAGIAGFCVAARVPEAEVVLVERDPVAQDAARRSLARPANAAFAARVRIVEADIAAPEIPGLGRDQAEAVIINPPFHQRSATSPSPDPSRAAAHVLAGEGLEAWFRVAVSLLREGGQVVAIFRADGLDSLLSAIGRRLGGLDILPIHPRAERPAHRVLVRGTKGSRASLRLLPALVLHADDGNGFLPQVEAMLREGAGLAESHPPWKRAAAGPS